MGALAALWLTVFNSLLGLSILFPIVGPLSRQLGLSEPQAGLFATGYAAMQFLLAPVWGRRSERGRKPVLLLGILGFAAGFYLFALGAAAGLAGRLRGAPLFLVLLSARLLGGAFSSATLPTAQAYLADLSDRADRTARFALLGAAVGLGIVLGPALGAALASAFGLLAPVVFSATLAMGNAWFAWRALPESRPTRAVPPARLSVGDRRVRPLLALALVLQLASVSLEQALAFTVQDRFRLSALATVRHVGLALVVYGLVAVAVQGGVAARWRPTPRRALAVGVPLSVAGFVVLALAPTFPALLGGLTLQAAGQALALPGVTAALSLAVRDDEQGAVAGLTGAAQGLGRLLGPLLGTGLYRWAPRAPYWLGAALGLAAWAGALVALRPDRAARDTA